MDLRPSAFGKGDSEGRTCLAVEPPEPPQVSMRLISHRPLLGAFVVVAGDVTRPKQDSGE
jgi:hypothetical protein